MSQLAYRSNTLIVNENSDPNAWGANYTVTAYEPGAQVASVSGTTVTVRAGHGFAAGDKLIKLRDGSFDLTVYTEVSSVTGTTVVTQDDISASIAAGDMLINLGADTGGTSPNYDASGLTIYSDMDGSTSVTNSRVTADATGRYEYWWNGRESWELIRDASGTPAALEIVAPTAEGLIRYAHDYATGGSGTSGSPWTGWDAALGANQTVVFVPGYFGLGADATVSVPSGCSLIGDGRAAIIIRTANNTGNTYFLTLDATSADVVDVLIEGLKFDGDAKTTSRGIILDAGASNKARRVVVRKNVFANMRVGMNVEDCVDVRVEDNLFTAGTETNGMVGMNILTGTAGTGREFECMVLRNVFRDCRTALGITGYYVLVEDNKIFNWGNGGAGSAGVHVGLSDGTYAAAQHVVLSRNYFDQSSGVASGTTGAIRLGFNAASTYASTDGTYIYVLDNHINGMDSGSSGQENGIQIDNPVNFLFVRGNIIQDAHGHPLRCTSNPSSSVTLTDWYIENNVFLNCNAGQPADNYLAMDAGANGTYANIFVRNNVARDDNSKMLNFFYPGASPTWTNALTMHNNYAVDSTQAGDTFDDLEDAQIGQHHGNIAEASHRSHIVVGDEGYQASCGNAAGATAKTSFISAFRSGTSINRLTAHNIKTEHNSGAYQSNRWRFYLWDFGTDATTALGTYNVKNLGLISFASATDAAEDTLETVNGGIWRNGYVSELVTVQAAATSTSSSLNLPANSIIEAVAFRVTVAPPGTATMDIGDNTGSADTRFFDDASTVLDTTGVTVSVHNPANTDANGPVQVAANRIKITPNATPSDATGRVRIVVYYKQFSAPTG